MYLLCRCLQLEMGAATLQDLIFLTESDLMAAGLKLLERKRLLKAIAEQLV